MEFKIKANNDGTKELHFRQSANVELTVVNLGSVVTPADPSELFAWITGELKARGLVPPDTVFRLGS
jgi:hypothetical protein